MENNAVVLWKPIKTIPNEILDVNSVNLSGNTLTISLCDENNDYIFIFNELISNYGTYKYTSTMHNMEINSKIGYWYKQCELAGETYPLLVLYSSEYIESIKRQSYYAFSDSYENLRHYIFITYDAVIEVISTKEPTCHMNSH